MSAVNKKILIFSTNYFPYIGGAEVAIKEITDRIGADKAEFDMVVPRYSIRNKAFERIGNVNVYRVGFGSFFDKWMIPFTGFGKARTLQSSRHYDAIWCMMASQASIAAARFKKANPEIRLVLTLQEGDEESHLKRYVFGNEFLYKLLIRPLYMKVFNSADHITAISNYLILRGQRNTNNAPTTLIPNGVDSARFNKGKDHELRGKLGIVEDDKVVITTSRLVEKNGVGDLVDAMRHLPENTKLVIVGDGSERGALELRVKSLELGERIIFVGGVGQEEIPNYLSIADVFCRPSLSEGQGISFLEAMAAGVPVVATPVGGIPDFLKDGATGLFCNKKDPKDIARAIGEILDDDTLSALIQKNARTLVLEKYDWGPLSQKMFNTLIK
ncbi:hypothetical protein COW81_03405 [Candidatus Campbellbacteria bacterium CG22_combo_CG10-13_8_21_14_all_36_13]|uniref:Glycosyl transferase family 1 domain-containing protein n=1 Tax=Candidatus Campbellbacteria bacterium CG22_combo_CG10-13_8_21_14_all_36_13 TaxID=1974529 RepID=A0A2H0DXI3_9BACT|nr:MAG: hypothetical protein COW81_03405 [Candidatus Campbellbacteria bacterium CG22_combo_CG10-13_8_21_14_all_36_13]